MKQVSPTVSPLLCKEVDYSSKNFLGARTNQEDYSSFQISPSGLQLLAVLADGMGGHSGGEIASKKAVDGFISTFKGNNSDSILVKLGAALNQANSEIASTISSSPALDGMGCTLVAMHIGPEGVQWISVGDSPLFLFRNGKLTRLNADHSMTPLIDEAVRLGNLSKEEALRHPDRHALRSAVTGEDLAIIDTSAEPLKLYQGDVVLLASDGLLSLTDDEISRILKINHKEDANILVSKLIEAVVSKQKPKQDNTTIQVFIAPQSFGYSSSKSLIFWSLIASFVMGLALLLFNLTGKANLDFTKNVFESRDSNPQPSKPTPTPMPVNVDLPTLNGEPKPVVQPTVPSLPSNENRSEPSPKDSINKSGVKNRPNAQNEKPAKVSGGNSKSNLPPKVGVDSTGSSTLPVTPTIPAASSTSPAAPAPAPAPATVMPAAPTSTVVSPPHSSTGVTANPTAGAAATQQPSVVNPPSSSGVVVHSSNPSVKNPGTESISSRPPVIDLNPSPAKEKQ